MSPQEAAIVQQILAAHLPDREVRAFGSRAGGPCRPHSDLDLVIMGEQPVTLDVIATLREAFSESDLPWKVDLLDWASTSEEFREVVARRNVLVRQRAR
ncbi:MAG: nucleotidyltransferase domain-containing protein [Pseudomonadota bacterium]|nr:nucleotidyltransferase domain-containing protein [Pseudomonadota bacterium]